MKSIIHLGPFAYDPILRDRFRNTRLWKEWRRQYPNLFDEDDERIAASQAKRGYHFYEWLAAIVIFHTTGCLSLIEKYQYKNHTRKQRVLLELGALDALQSVLRKRAKDRAQLPDLLVYKPDYTNWFLCEIKGENDRLRQSQLLYFTKLRKNMHKPVTVVKFYPVKSKTT